MSYQDYNAEYKKVLKRFVEDMKAAGATGVITVDFDGIGDSGTISHNADDAQKEIVAKLGYAFDYRRYFTNDAGECVQSDDKTSLLAVIYELIPFSFNDEGGYGSVELDIDNTRISMNSHRRTTTYDTTNDEF